MGAEKGFFVADRLLGNFATEQVAKVAESAGIRMAEEAIVPKAITKVTQEKLESQAAEQGLKKLGFDKAAWLGAGDEGAVYSNADGTVTKVFHSLERDLHAEKAMYDELSGMGVKVPKIHEIGVVEDGRPAMRIQQIGDGDNLQTQLLLGQVPRNEMPTLLSQYDTMATTLQSNGARVDWQLKNMAWDKGDLYLLDPSYLKRDQALPASLVERMRPH